MSAISGAVQRSRSGYEAAVPETVQRWLDRNGSLLLVLPGLFAFATFMLFPLVFTLFISFTDATSATIFQGAQSFATVEIFGLSLPFGNYVELYADPQFWTSFGITWLFVATSVGLKVGLGVFIAMILTGDRVRGKRWMRAIVIIPLGLPGIFTITVWSGIFSSARFGLMNRFLSAFGAGPINWLQGSRWMAFLAYNVTEMWLAYPFMVIITVSALQAVPAELHDAAKVDGAGYLHRFWHVTVPAIKRPVLFAAILTAAASFQQFLIPFIFNQGGPSRNNELIILYGYKEAFQQYQYGYGAAIMLTAVFFIGIFMWINVKKGRLAEGVDDE
ncbi:carbohydrate ABC transporter permease [Halomontanus rarus]|uniref:carbohydrate ABC transporter permease n=1 Tax=Halomontanus rarus TaxID=3034020 RepID=UPI0023E7E19B|nr:sugar ABC transporter permease [Halovivax sp. TS33]